MSKQEIETIKINEVEIREILKEKGFETNYKKHENENGVDIIALKDGYSYLIEHKRLQLRENGSYRYGGEVKGEILILSTPSGNSFFCLGEGMSLTKTARLADIIFGK